MGLNPFSVEIDLPFGVFKQLKKLHLLERDRETDKRRICERVFGLIKLLYRHDFRPDRKLGASDPGYKGACSKGSGYSSSFLKALAPDRLGIKIYPLFGDNPPYDLCAPAQGIAYCFS
jgi:hypothetical protein